MLDMLLVSLSQISSLLLPVACLALLVVTIRFVIKLTVLTEESTKRVAELKEPIEAITGEGSMVSGVISAVSSIASLLK